MSPEQLRFDWPQPGSVAAGDFFVSSSNQLAYDAVMGGDWPRGKLCLTGPEGSGKSHIARIWAGATGAAVLSPDDLSGAPKVQPTVVEGADRLSPAQEEALFHLHNALSGQAPLLLTAREAPSRWPTRLPDLASRMQGTMVVTIDAPDDTLMEALIVKQFADRQLAVPPDLVRFLAPRLTRSHAAVAEAVNALDQTALALGREVNRALASDWLNGKLARVMTPATAPSED